MGFAVLNCSQKGTLDTEEEVSVVKNLFYRDQMRTFIQNISAHAKAKKPGFAIIPQNGIELVTTNGMPTSAIEMDYLSSIDAHGQESLFYGDTRDNGKTKESRSTYLMNLLDISKNTGNTIIVTDYCSTESKVDDSYALNLQHGYVGFAADDRNLTTIPPYPQEPILVNDENIQDIQSVKNHIFLLNYAKFPTKEALIAALKNTNYDLLVLDAFFNDGSPFTAEDVAQLKQKQNGGDRLVVSYMSIGEAEDYRGYWDLNWDFEAPDWLGEENPRWKGNYKVKYWDQDWQDLIAFSETSYLNSIINAGFDGVYMDIVDAFEHFEELEGN